MINMESYINVLEKFKITQAQFIMLYCIHFKKWDIINRYKKLYPTTDGSMIGNRMKQDLINRKLLIVNGKKANEMYLSKQAKSIFIDTMQSADEIWEFYPSEFNKNGIYTPSKNVDIIQFRLRYNLSILNDAFEHEEVFKDLKYMIYNNLIDCNILDFVKSKLWLNYREKREKNEK